MKFAVRIGDGAARCGVLHLGEGFASLQTPCLLLQTRKGLPAFVTPELLGELHPDARGLAVNPTHFLDGPPVHTIRAVGGAHQLVSLPDCPMIALTRDSFSTELDGKDNSKLGATFDTISGRFVVGPERYMEMVNALQPNLWASLPDEVSAHVTSKRNVISVDRTLQWLDRCLDLQSVHVKQKVFGSIVGGSILGERMRSATETVKRDVFGFSLAGFGLGETPEDRRMLLEAVLECLPSEKPRLVSGMGTPEEVLEAVSAGVDIFNCPYPHVLTRGGYAMTFALPKGETSVLGSQDKSDKATASTKEIDLRSVSYRCDVMPILAGCDCYTCRRHSRAYINHLLNAGEMVAETLLDMHNIHHYLRFFRAIRDAISGSYFNDFRAWFAGQTC